LVARGGFEPSTSRV